MILSWNGISLRRIGKYLVASARHEEIIALLALSGDSVATPLLAILKSKDMKIFLQLSEGTISCFLAERLAKPVDQ